MSHENYKRRDNIKVGSDRSFGLVFGGIFLLIGAGPLLFSHPARWWSMGLAAVFCIISFLRPQLLNKPKMLWFRFGLLLHKIVSPVILAALFFLVFLPIGLLLRLFGKDLLNLKWRRDTASYWIRSEKIAGSMRDQF